MEDHEGGGAGAVCPDTPCSRPTAPCRTHKLEFTHTHTRTRKDLSMFLSICEDLPGGSTPPGSPGVRGHGFSSADQGSPVKVTSDLSTRQPENMANTAACSGLDQSSKHASDG